MTRALGIAGVGLIGGSIALRARAAGWITVGYDRDNATLDGARAGGALDDVAPDLAELAHRSDVVAIALPVDATIAALQGVPQLAEPRLVFDVASVKVPIAAAGAHLPRFVASHPLAGRESSGFPAANGALFEGRSWVVDSGADVGARGDVLSLIESFGARVVEMSPADHDRLVALTSHLPQALAVALGARIEHAAADDPRTYDVCGPGIASMLRLARSPADLWAAIFRANAAPLSAELRSLARALESAADALDEGEVGALMSYFADAGTAVAGMERVDSADRSTTYAVPTR